MPQLEVPSDPDDPSNVSRARVPRLGAALERRPLYRVVEYVRDVRGRLHEQGRIWHSDLQRVRQFGRAVADNTAGSRVVIADNAGRVVEELALPGLDHAAQGAWEGWRERPLPQLPPAFARAPLRREAPVTPAAAWVLPAETRPAKDNVLPALPAPAGASATSTATAAGFNLFAAPPPVTSPVTSPMTPPETAGTPQDRHGVDRGAAAAPASRAKRPDGHFPLHDTPMPHPPVDLPTLGEHDAAGLP